MNKKKIGLAVTIVPVLAAGTVAMASAYKSGTDFKPFQNDQEIQTNQVVFDGDESGVDRKKKDDSKESSLLKDKQDDQEKESTELKDQADYLFENEQVNTKAVGLLDGENTGSDIPKQDQQEEEQQKPEETYSIVKDPSKADTELMVPRRMEEMEAAVVILQVQISREVPQELRRITAKQTTTALHRLKLLVPVPETIQQRQRRLRCQLQHRHRLRHQHQQLHLQDHPVQSRIRNPRNQIRQLEEVPV